MYICASPGEMSIWVLGRRQGFLFFFFFFHFFATYPEFLMGILHNWRAAFPWGKCNHLTSFFFICILRNWWFNPMGSLYLFTVTFAHLKRILCYLGKRGGKKKKRIWLSLLFCQFFLPHRGMCISKFDCRRVWRREESKKWWSGLGWEGWGEEDGGGNVDQEEKRLWNWM